ncbi:hypothetical protein PPERSA_06482 [Pseudocohnilembus persalinus]|uniref:EFHB C-terminal EF-hand domain-containing protein n=1 Tax=Pseudocohnilembus persalinus TaxID=266149 RepID=A0A0V0QS76_PSEPJ|nr:hypothetical protein PPERSA_06482 [Pseudocohnilembus persalinus]|eukprot:KRX04848.1 hypothetical protein PPERSA_06482 [Pseudocohnilembus persalinus]
MSQLGATTQGKYDFFPNQKIAGVSRKVDGQSAGNCLKMTGLNISNGTQSNQEPSTPEHIKKYRKSYKQQHGKTILHYGVADDVIDKSRPFGHKVLPSDHADQCLKNDQYKGINQLISEINENKYASRHKEPLGKRMERNYNFPQETQSQNFRFGKVTQQNEYTGKEVMFPQEIQDNDGVQNYVKSFGDQRVGCQKDRNYNWPVDKNQHRFGKQNSEVFDEIKYCLNQESLPDQFQKTTIVKKKQEDFRNYKEDPLGQPKNQGQVNSYVGSQTVYGARPKNQDEWSVGNCIKGEATLKQALPDSDLGKTNKFGFRNTTKPGDEDRCFGVPTIRDDINKPKVRSVADPNNYGDEPSGVQLLFPQVYEHMGVSQQDFQKKRPKAEIRSIFEAVGIKYKTGKFEGIFARAMEIEGTQEEEVSVRAFEMANAEMGHLD